MKRPIPVLLIGTIIGILWGLCFKQSIALFVCAILIVLLLIENANKSKISRKWIRNKQLYYHIIKLGLNRKIIAILAIACFFSNCYTLSLEIQYKRWQKELSQKENITIIGTVMSSSIEKEYQIQYLIKLEQIDGKKDKTGKKIILIWKKGRKNVSFSYGDRILITGTYEKLEGARNEGGYDEEKNGKANGIWGKIIGEKIEKLESKPKNLSYFIYRFKVNLENRVQKELDKENAMLFQAIILGDKNNLPKEVKENFQKSNVSHLLALSGTHIGYLLLFVNSMTNFIKGKERIKQICLILLLMAFCILTGNTPSVFRACFMTCYGIGAKILGRKVDKKTAISFPALLTLLRNPYTIYHLGFLFSYLGILAILFVSPILSNILKRKTKEKKTIHENTKEKRLRVVKENAKRRREIIRTFQTKLMQKGKDMIAITISVYLVLLPILLVYFHTFSLTSIITNLLITPIFSLIIFASFSFLLCFCFFPFATSYMAPILNQIYFFFYQFVIQCSNIPFSQISTIRPSNFEILLYYLLLGIFVLFWKLVNKKQNTRMERKLLQKIEKKKQQYQAKKEKYQKRAIALILSFLFLLFFLQGEPKPFLQLYFIDVGQR